MQVCFEDEELCLSGDRVASILHILPPGLEKRAADSPNPPFNVNRA